MPELPEVETMCRGIAAAVGCRIRDLRRPKSRLKSILISPRINHFRRRVAGRRIAAVRRVGKRVVLELEPARAGSPHPSPLPKGEGTKCTGSPHPNSPLKKSIFESSGATAGLSSSVFPSVSPRTAGQASSGTLFRRTADPLPKGEGTKCAGNDLIVLEPRMTGLVLLANPPDEEHLRLVFSLEGGNVENVLFWDQRGLGVARLLSHKEFLQHYGPNRLGPDAMSISPDTLRERLGGGRRAIKVALLDQRALAGVGNLYASEILHRAGIHPAAPCRRLSAADWSRLHAAMRAVLRAAIRHQGSTLRDGTYRIARDDPGGYQRYHRVYQRKGEPCLQCGEARIERIVQVQRSTFFCPVCQRACGSRRRR